MKLFYEDPELQIRKYSLPPSDLITTSVPGDNTTSDPGDNPSVDLGDGDDYGDLFGK